MFNEEISILAFSCINEILSKNYVPRQLEEFLLQIFLKIFTLLDRVTQNSDIINQLDERYLPFFLHCSPSPLVIPSPLLSVSFLTPLSFRFVNKLTQFTLLFVSNHFHRVETNPNFPIIGFLTLLYKYTFMQTSPETLQSCLEIWEAFLDYTIAQKNKEGAVLDAKSLFHSYQTGLLALSDQLSKTIQYGHNAALLDQMDDSSESEESEKESFLKICLDIIARVADLYPMTVLEHSVRGSRDSSLVLVLFSLFTLSQLPSSNPSSLSSTQQLLLNVKSSLEGRFLLEQLVRFIDTPSFLSITLDRTYSNLIYFILSSSRKQPSFSSFPKRLHYKLEVDWAFGRVLSF
jgi:hypothetical protein